MLQEISDSVREVAGVLRGAVVGIGDRWAVGSGIVVSDGHVLTNAHNVRGEDVGVHFLDGRSVRGTVAGTDFHGDLAVVPVETEKARPLDWADGAALEIGLPVFAAANPGGQGLRVTFGLISAVERSFRGPGGGRIRGAIEHTAPLLPGSSGGPVVDSSGRLLGINTNRLGEGFYLAIPADESLRTSIDALSRGEAPRRRRLGVGLAPAHVARRLRRAVGLSDADGLLVRHVEDASPAAAAGLSEGDLIVAVAGREVSGVDALYDALEASGDSLEVKVLRGNDERVLTVALEKRS